MSDTIAAVSTGMQVSAIGILRLSGDKAINIVDKLFIPRSGKKMSESEDRKLVFGSLCDLDGQTLDICLCTISRAPHSYTGENTAEIQCHGSPAVLRAALDAVFGSDVVDFPALGFKRRDQRQIGRDMAGRTAAG